ncbi:MAG: dipeptidyl-peptidase 3 family protein [Terriglobales bacterium]
MKRLASVLLIFFSITLLAQKGSRPSQAELEKMAARFAPTELNVDTSSLSAGDRKALVKLIQAARIMDDLQLEQLWSGNHALLAKLKKDRTPLGRTRLRYFWINKGPWSELDEHRTFVPGAPDHRPEGGNFYPPDAGKEDLEKWMNSLPEAEKNQAQGFFTVVRRDARGKLVLLPYSKEYASRLKQAALLLRQAAAATDNASLKKFLTLRADAFLSNDYFDSDVAWMDLDSPLDVTIGPYETYNDELFGYKACFEAYVNLRDEQETKRLAFFAKHLQSIEDNLPIPAEHRNPKIGGLAPIVVVNQVFSAGDGNQGVATAAYNLPNDERVVAQKGSKRILLKNIQQAKFQKTLVPISRVVLSADDQKHLDFDAFFTHILAHEITHGLGPQQIKVGGRDTSVRQELKEHHGSIEEAKADVTGLFSLQYLMDKGLLGDSIGQGEAAERRLYTTYLASAFRTLRFGVKSAHARGMAMQFNYLRDRGAFLLNPDGTFAVDMSKIKQAVRDLDRDLLMLEATGDYAGAKKMLERLSVVRPEVQAAIDKLKDVPVDIALVPVTADQVAPVRGGR